MVNFSEVSVFLAQSPLIQHSLKVLEEVEQDLLFSIACEKDKIFREKKKVINQLKTKVIANNTNFGKLSRVNRFGSLDILSIKDVQEFFDSPDFIASLEDCLVLMTSNVFAEIGIEKLGLLYSRLPRTIFAVHDYDNHHWFNNNIQAAIFSDVYIPSHQGDNLIASKINPNIFGGIPCGTNQWSKEFIQAHSESLLKPSRSSEPLGKYYLYQKFSHRNKAIATLNQAYPTVGIVDKDFHTLSEDQKWQEWVDHKLHWIIPVLNDLPIRFFDSLVTGGLPLVPSGLSPYIEALGIPKKFYITYGPLDLIEHKHFTDLANFQFDQLGPAGIIERHKYALENFHVDVIVEKIISKIHELYDIR
jgi:hypothetical protein